jgi:hypothetical protein
MYGKISIFGGAPWLGTVHRWSGRLAFIASIPVALHCLYALGFGDYNTRVLVHSLLGCFFFFGGLVFTALSGLFVTSALWFFTTSGFKL